TGSMSQTVSLAAGTYQLRFQAAQRPGNSQTLRVLVDGNLVGTFQPTGTSYQAFTTFSFTVTAGSHTIEFLGLNLNGGDNTVFIDAVSTSAKGVNWQASINVPIDGLTPGQYVLYAVVNDGFNAPVVSANSVPFTPNFAVQGQVANQNNDPEGGWSVFLDYNNNGVQDPNEPGTKTDASGFYGF